MRDDQLYIDLSVKMKRLMSLNARDNRHLYEPIQKQLKDLRDHGEVSEKVIELAPYMPWR
jgi:hypothetical protein